MRAAGPRDSYRHQQLTTMRTVFGTCGGIVTADGLADRLRSRHGQSLSLVARWMVQRSVLSFEWRGQWMLPLFQFDPHTLLPDALLPAVVAELHGAFDEWEASLWFASPNAWLADATPVARWHSDRPAVLEAARADRFVARA